jgi:hypothetical protein
VEGGISVDDCDAIAATRGRLYELAAFSAPGDYAELAHHRRAGWPRCGAWRGGELIGPEGMTALIYILAGAKN